MKREDREERATGDATAPSSAAGTDASLDGRAEVSPDAGPDASPDVNPDASADASPGDGPAAYPAADRVAELTTAQLDAARAAGSVAVVAGAGTGKTHMLAHRYLHHLRQGLSPLEVVAATFTNRAADELRARIRTLVRERMPGRPEVLAELEAAPIGTLHALALRICHDHPEAAGAPASFAVLDELEGAMWRDEQLEAALEDLPGAVYDHVPYDTLRDAMELLLGNPAEAEAILAVGPDTWPELIRRRREDATRTLVTSDAWQEAIATLRANRGTEGDLAEDARRRALLAHDAFAAGDVEAAVELADYSLRGGRAGNWSNADLAAVKSALKTVRDALRAAAAGDAGLRLGPEDEVLAAALPYLERAFRHVRGRLDGAKRARRVLDFADHEAMALKALADADVRAWYAERWKAVLVDEFQDTNAVQERLIHALTDGMCVTIVGDEKQAIFGFRGAVAGVFQRVRAGLVALGGEVVNLDRSFRTHASLLGQLNRIAEPMLGELSQPLQAARLHAPGVQPAGPTDPAAAGVPEVRFLQVGKSTGLRKAQRLLLEARAVGGEILRMVEQGTLVYDKRMKVERPVEAGDIAVLARAWRTLDTYADVLPGLGVPVVHAGGSDLFATREAKDGVALLRFLAYPLDDLALAAVLRAPYFAVDDAALARFAAHVEALGPGADGPRSAPGVTDVSAPDPDDSQPPPEPPISWWEAMQAEPPAELARAVAVLGALLARRRDEPPSRLLQRIDAATGYVAVVSNLPGGLRREADWRGFVALVRSLEVGAEDAFAVDRRLRRLLRAEIEVARPDLEAHDAVRLMSIHRAKGLEWPVVVLADLGRNPGARWVTVRADPNLGLAFTSLDEDGDRAKPALYRVLEQEAAERDRAEAARLAYVGITRARDHLLLAASDDAGGLLEALEPGLRAAGIPAESVAYQPGEAVYPDPPAPTLPSEVDDGSWAEALRPPPTVATTAGTTAASNAAPAATSATPATAPGATSATPPTTPDDEVWALIVEVLAPEDPEFLPVFEALRAGGIRAPAEDALRGVLNEGGVPQLDEPFLLCWEGPQAAPRVALVARAPHGERDERVVVADPASPADTLAAVRAALGEG